MGKRIEKLVLVTPFDSGIASLSDAEQLVLLKGCVLCQITRDLDNESTKSKTDWRACKAELGVQIAVYTLDRADAQVLEAIDRQAPAVCAFADGEYHLLLDEVALARCKGSVADFRGRLGFRASSLGLEL